MDTHGSESPIRKSFQRCQAELPTSMTDTSLDRLTTALIQHDRWAEPLLKRQAAFDQTVAATANSALSRAVKQMQSSWAEPLLKRQAAFDQTVAATANSALSRAVKQMQSSWAEPLLKRQAAFDQTVAATANSALSRAGEADAVQLGGAVAQAPGSLRFRR